VTGSCGQKAQSKWTVRRGRKEEGRGQFEANRFVGVLRSYYVIAWSGKFRERCKVKGSRKESY
jgi:hypothetical protein